MKFLEMKAWSFRLALLSLVAFCADAADSPAALKLEALVLPYASPWQRATPQQEREDDALLLDAAESHLHLAVPRRTRLLKFDADAYYARLRENWLKLYGGDAKISWFESGGTAGNRKWLLCRRPSRDQEVEVFHLSTVFAGRAYSLLLFAPAKAENLPQAALDLLAAVRFAGDAPVAPAAPEWTLTRTIYPHANADELATLVRDDAARLGEDGMVTGYGLDFSADPGQPGVAWFIEGYQWQSAAARPTRVAWKQGGRLELRAAPEAPVWPVKLTLEDNESDVRVSLRVHTLCAVASRVAEVLAQLQRGALLSRQLQTLEPAAGCPADAQAGAAPVFLLGESGKAVQADLAVSLPPALAAAELEASRLAGLSRIGLVEIGLEAGPRRTAYGNRLLERAHWYVVFEQGGAAGRR